MIDLGGKFQREFDERAAKASEENERYYRRALKNGLLFIALFVVPSAALIGWLVGLLILELRR